MAYTPNTEVTSNKGQANGYASLDSGGKVPVTQLPNSVAGGAIYAVDQYGADPTGATFSDTAVAAALAAMGSNPGRIVFGVGIYKLNTGLNYDNSKELKPKQSIVGQGSALTRIDFRGTGACFEVRNRTFATTSTDAAGEISDLSIWGWNNTNTNTCGIRYGDIWRMRISDVEISGFNQTGGKGLWGDNQSYWSERANIECIVNQCTECFVFESNTGSLSSGSFDYSKYELSFVAQPNQHAFVLRAGSVANSKASMNGVTLQLTGNCQLSAVGQPNTGVMFRVGKDDADASSFSGELQIGVETSGTAGGTGHIDFMQGTGASYQITSRVTASGSINLIPYSGSNFQTGNAGPRTFAFGGLLKNSPSLGSVGTVQSFQSLQLLSQARGGWFLSKTNEVQTIYITQATGGTFTLTYGGQTTSALAYNATAAAVQAALQGLSSIGSGNVTVSLGQARYVNSVMLTERAYTVEFGGALQAASLPLITVNSSLTGTGNSTTVVHKVPGSVNDTYTIYLENGNIFLLEPLPGTYRLKFSVGGLTAMAGVNGADSPFGVTSVDIWIKQPDTGGSAIFEPTWFAPAANSGSTAKFYWADGVEPTMSTTPGFIDIIRLTSYNFSVWSGTHLTKQIKATDNLDGTASL